MNKLFLNGFRKSGILVLPIVIVLLLFSSVFANAKDLKDILEIPPVAAVNSTKNKHSDNPYSQFLNIEGRKMHIVMYGDMKRHGNKVIFDNNSTKKTIVFLPALGIVSPEIYFKPLAEALKDDFNILIVEPFGYGQSDDAKSKRTVKNINKEFNKVIQELKIEKFILAAHSISGIYALNYTLDYDKVEKILALDITVSDDSMAPLLEEETAWMLSNAEAFNVLRNSFSSNKDFVRALYENPEKYGSLLPEVNGYQYSEEDKIKYIKAFSKSYNPTIIDEIKRSTENVKTIQGKKFPSSIPVLSFVAGNTIGFFPQWETAHADQLDLTSGNHLLYILQGASHYLWYTHLEQMVNQIKTW